MAGTALKVTVIPEAYRIGVFNSAPGGFMVFGFLAALVQFFKFLSAKKKDHAARIIERGFTHMQVSFGCTGGQHRSVYCAEHLAQHLKDQFDVQIQLIHRERGIAKEL